MKKLIAYIALALLMIVVSNTLYVISSAVVHKHVVSAIPSYWYSLLDGIYWALIVIVIPWIGLLPLILFALRKYELRPGGWIHFSLLHLVILSGFSFAQIVIHVFFEPGVSGLYYNDVLFRLINGLMFWFAYNVFFYVFVVAAYFAVTFLRQLKLKELNEARLAENLANAQLNSLKMKLQPHFLFNALQSVNVLVLDGQVDAASEMIEKLSILLRLSIDRTDSQLETVQKELEMLDYYLGIEEIRYKDQLTIEKSIDPAVMKALVPSLILQPLIENSLKHGISGSLDAGIVNIEIHKDGEFLNIAVKNDGPGLPEGWNLEEHAGVGLNNTIRRLELHYGDTCKFAITGGETGGVETRISIPFTEQIVKVGEE